MYDKYYLTGSCGGTFSASVGAFTSPDLSEYPSGVNCTYTITVDEGHIIRLTFLTFNMMATSYCSSNYVAVYDSMNEPDEDVLGRFVNIIISKSKSNLVKYGYNHFKKKIVCIASCDEFTTKSVLLSHN